MYKFLISSALVLSAGTLSSDFSLQEWKDNEFFAENHAYSKVVKLGTSMHPQAVEQLSPILADWVGSRRNIELSLLDLACGTETPVAPYFMAQSLEKYNVRLNYTGVDINQSLKNVRFTLPSNVTSQTLHAQDAYQVNFLLDKQEKFSIIYSGLNLHHLSPREFVKVVRDYKNLLEDDGIFIIFDVFRPSEYPFVPKPSDKQMIDPALLADIPEVEFSDQFKGQDWRENLIGIYATYAQSKGMEEETLRQVETHILQNDYPMTMDEVANLLKENGYAVEKQDMYPFSDSYPQVPVSPFFGIIVAKAKNESKQ